MRLKIHLIEEEAPSNLKRSGNRIVGSVEHDARTLGVLRKCLALEAGIAQHGIGVVAIVAIGSDFPEAESSYRDSCKFLFLAPEKPMTSPPEGQSSLRHPT